MAACRTRGGRRRPSRISLARDGIREQPESVCASFPTGAPWASMPTASMTLSGPRPAVRSRIVAGHVVVRREGRSSRRRSGRRARAAPGPGRCRRPGRRRGGARCGTPCRRSGPGRARPAAAVRHRGVLHRLPGRRQHVGEVEEAIVRRPLRHLDRAELGLRHAQELGLAAGDLAVELGVAEQRRTLALLGHLRGLALGVQVLVAHEAVPAGDVEGHDDAVARPRGHRPRHRPPRRRPSAHGRGCRPGVMKGRAPRRGGGPSRTGPIEVTRMIASVGSWIVGSGTSSTLTSRLPCHVTARIEHPRSVGDQYTRMPTAPPTKRSLIRGRARARVVGQPELALGLRPRHRDFEPALLMLDANQRGRGRSTSGVRAASARGQRSAVDDFAAIGMEHLAGHVGGIVAGEKDVAWGDFVGLPARPRGTSEPKVCDLLPGKVAGISGVQIGPGATALTRMPRFTTACASERVKRRSRLSWRSSRSARRCHDRR